MSYLAETSKLIEIAHKRKVSADTNLSGPQLPVSWYFDPDIYKLEQELLFKNGPGYVGHELMVPEVGDYQVLDGRNKGQVLVRGKEGISLLSNVCRHRQALMLKDKGNTSNIVCPLHRWTYDLKGELLGAPHFPQKPCLNLARTPLQNWQGLLFDGQRNIEKDLAQLTVKNDLYFDDYKLDKVIVMEGNYNWKTFIEVYLEDYHVQPFHPGLSSLVDCNNLQWDFGDWYSVQTVGLAHQLQMSGSQAYERWHRAIVDYYQGTLPKYGAIWLTYYPNVMIEWYAHTLIVSTLIPLGPNKTKNIVEFYYPEEIALFEPEFVEAEQAAYMETAKEDDEIIMRMEEGRFALYQSGINEVGPYQSPLEDGMPHFHKFLRRELKKAQYSF